MAFGIFDKVRKGRENLEIEQELMLLEQSFNADVPAITKPKIVPTVPNSWGGIPNVITWEVLTPQKEPYHMSLGYHSEHSKTHVLTVDTEKLYYHWLKSKLVHGRSHCVLRRDMESDYKYKDAVKGFAEGKENPVPLAYAVARYRDGQPNFGFVNGVTRTFWLINNRVPSFPISVEAEKDAENLYKWAGVGDAPKPAYDFF